MGKVKQVAIQMDLETLNQVDAALSGGEFSSRAAVIRAAVDDWLARRRAREIDAALARGYAADPQTPDEDAWADLSLEGLAEAHLDW